MAGIELINETIESLPLFALFSAGLNLLKLLVGGLFGLYAISFIVSTYLRMRERKMLKEIKDELKVLSRKVSSLEKGKRK